MQATAKKLITATAIAAVCLLGAESVQARVFVDAAFPGAFGPPLPAPVVDVPPPVAYEPPPPAAYEEPAEAIVERRVVVERHPVPVERRVVVEHRPVVVERRAVVRDRAGAARREDMGERRPVT